MSPTKAQRYVYFAYMYYLTEKEMDDLNNELPDDLTYKTNIIRCILYIKLKDWEQVNNRLKDINVDTLQKEITNKKISLSLKGLLDLDVDTIIKSLKSL